MAAELADRWRGRDLGSSGEERSGQAAAAAGCKSVELKIHRKKKKKKKKAREDAAALASCH